MKLTEETSRQGKVKVLRGSHLVGTVIYLHLAVLVFWSGRYRLGKLSNTVALNVESLKKRCFLEGPLS